MVHRRVRARFLAGVVGAVLALAAIGSGVALAADHAVAISGFSFSPHDISVAVGDTVTWTNSDAQAHTATADDGSFDTGTLGNNASGSATFSKAGSFPYHCSIHSSMTGTVTVQAASSGGSATNPPTDTVATAPPGDASVGIIGTALVLVGTLLIGFAIGRVRFSRPQAGR
ncbi:MAG: cupredoxin family copper-binding protein [Chloroflexota bacterium]